MTSTPSIVLVPGAWHRAVLYAPLTSRLKKAGFDVHDADYPSTAAEPTTKDLNQDVAAVQSVILPLVDAGKDVVLLLHSAGGMLAGEVTRGISKRDRQAASKPGGIIGLIYLCAFVADEGNSLWSATHGPQDWEQVDGDVSVADPARRKELFYNECTPAQAEECASQLLKFSLAFSRSKATHAAFKYVPSSYLVCTNDHTIPVVAQEAMIAQPGAAFRVVRCEADHSPFQSMPDLTAGFVIEETKRFANLSGQW